MSVIGRAGVRAERRVSDMRRVWGGNRCWVAQWCHTHLPVQELGAASGGGR